MKKLIVMLILGMFLISVNSPIVTPYVSDRQNVTITDIVVDGDISLGIGSSRDNSGTTIEIQEESGFGATDKMGIISWNTTTYFNNPDYYNNRIENHNIQIKYVTSNGWNAGETIDISRLNGTRINTTTPTASELRDLIEAGGHLDSFELSDFLGGSIQNFSANVFLAGSLDMWNQRPQLTGDGYYSVGFDHTGLDNGDDVDLDSVEGGYNTELIVQTSCAPPIYIEGNSNWQNGWIINKTCVITDEQYNIANVTIQDSGHLIMNGTTEINVTKENSAYYFKLVKGGKITGRDKLKFRA